ncbi:Hint domain-containing protein [Phocaeicola faecalis]
MTNNLFNLIPDGENFVKSNCPELYAALKETATPGIRLCAAIPDEDTDVCTGFQDVTDIQDISYDSDKKTLRAQSVAGFRERKGVIAIVSEVFDSVTGESIKGSAVTTNNAHSLVCNVNSEYTGKGMVKDSRFFVRSVFYWTETDSNGEVIMQSREVRRDSGLVYDEGEQIIKNITVEFPNTLKLREHTIILYSRNAETHVGDPDKVYPTIKPINNKLPFHIPFIGSVSVGTGKILGIDKEDSVIRLQHPEHKTEVTFNKDKNNNWKDIKWRYLNNNTCLTWEFPENWRNELDLKDLKINSVFDFYARLALNVDLMGSGFPIPVYITVGSNVEQDYTHCKIKQVFLQWGCLGEQTRIAMSDGNFKEIRAIKAGDMVNTGKGNAEVINIYSGEEKEIICIETETGKRLLLTGEHPVMTEEGWVRANDFNAAMRVQAADGSFEKLKGLYTIPYGKKVYNLKLNGTCSQLIAEGIVVGDFMQQNCMENQKQEVPIKGQENIAEEFQILVDEINRQKKW